MSITGDNGSQLKTLISTADSPPAKRLFVELDDDAVPDDSNNHVKHNIIT